MKLLFFPSDLGGGFGHISRCLAFAQEANRRGHESAFVINNEKYEKRLRDAFEVFTVTPYTERPGLVKRIIHHIIRPEHPASPLFTEFSTLDYQVVRDGLINGEVVTKRLAQYSNVVKTYKPDVLVGDTNLLVWMLAEQATIPAVQIIRYAMHPKTADLLWWKDKPEGLVSPNATTLFNPILMNMGLEPIQKAEELLQGDLFIVPSVPAIEPIPKDDKTVYVGELTLAQEGQSPSWLRDLHNWQPLVYVTVGGGAGSVGANRFFETIAETFVDQPVQVIVSTSNKFDPPDLINPPKNVRFFHWVPGQLLISQANLVIFHGGYATMMESLVHGKPSIIVPFHSEQEGNGRRLEQLGCGRVVKLSREPYQRIEVTWGYGPYTYLVQRRYDLTAENLKPHVDSMLHDPAYLTHARNLQASIADYPGAEEAMTLIEARWS